MYSVRDSDTPKTSQIMNKYYIAKLDQSKQQGEYCVENQECQSGVCYLRKCFPNSMILSHTLLDELWTLTGATTTTTTVLTHKYSILIFIF